MFDLDNAIKEWRRTLYKNEGMEDGYARELETHLRDEIACQMEQGRTQERAFAAAVELLGGSDSIGTEYYKSHTRRRSGRPPWKSPKFMPELPWQYLKIAVRRMRREKGYTLVNILGLAVGLACTILISLWVQQQKSFDRFHEKSDRIYQAYYTNKSFDGSAIYLPGPLAEELKDSYPEIIEASNFKLWKKKIAYGEKSFLGMGSYVDPSFFTMFTFPFLKGDKGTAFENPHSVVITEELATKLFGEEEPMGKTLSYYVFSQKMDLQVTGVMENVPDNSHFRFDFLIPYEIGYEWMKIWNNNSGFIYVLLEHKDSLTAVDQKIAGVLRAHRPESRDVLHLQSLERIHLYTPGGGGRILYVYIFSAMAVIILLIACINFMNLSTARSEKRFKEIGLKKVVGSSRGQLIRQFLTEAILTAFVSLLAALVLVQMLLPSLNAMLGTRLSLSLNLSSLAVLMAIAGFTGIVAGSYPAFFLSALQPAAIFKGRFSLGDVLKRGEKGRTASNRRGAALRKILVLAQFALSIFFVICVLMIHRQLDFLRNSDLGFEKEHVVVLESMGELKQRNTLVKEELLKLPEIRNVTFGAFSPIDWESSGYSRGINWTGKTSDPEFALGENYVDCNYADTFGLEMTEGRFFSRQFPTDGRKSCVVNEAACKAMEMENPIGKTITWHRGSARESTRSIIGVVKDFNTQSLHHQVKPFVLLPLEPVSMGMSNFMYLKIGANDIPQTIRQIRSKVKELVPNDPFVHYFLDEELAKMYEAEQLTARLTSYVSVLAVLISCLGLLALASFSVERRTKEIGIRKILGSSVSGIMVKLTKDFVKWVALANAAAWPLAYFVLNRWLKNFAYQADIDLWIFVFSGILALISAVAVVSYQTLRAATANPINALRYE